MEIKLSKFVAATIAFLKGDTDTTLAIKNERLAKAAIKGQLSALEGALVEAEVNLDNAKENLSKAIHPSTQILDAGGYYRNVVRAQESLKEAEEKLDNTKLSITNAEDLLKNEF